MGTRQKKKKRIVQNTKARDNGAKLIFDDPVLCSEFLRGYVDVELLKNVQPEDIEDISERFLPMWQEGRDADSVKKIHLKDTSLYIITSIEHQSEVHYDMPFRMLRYIVMILTDFQAEQEKLHPGITKSKDFRYPPVIPIVYYEGSNKWTAVRNFKERVYLNDVLDSYIPSFEYFVVPLRDYSNQEIIDKNDELSLIMLINKLKNSADFKTLKEIPSDYFKNLEENTPDYLLNILSKIIAVFLYRLNVPRKEVEAFTDQIGRRNFSMLFDSFEFYDVQETRREGRQEGRREGRREGKAEAVLDLLNDLGSISKELQQQILTEQDSERLTFWLKIAAKAETLSDFREKAGLQ